MANLTSFVESRMSLLVHVMRVWDEEGGTRRGQATIQAKREKYAFQQAFFYGAGYFINQRQYVSSAAMEKLEELNQAVDIQQICNLVWDDRKKIIGANYGDFHLEHIFSGDMCWQAIRGMWATQNTFLDVKQVESLIKNNYATAWILKTENTRLNGIGRGESLNSALNAYRQAQICLLDHLNMTVLCPINP